MEITERGLRSEYAKACAGVHLLKPPPKEPKDLRERVIFWERVVAWLPKMFKLRDDLAQLVRRGRLSRAEAKDQLEVQLQKVFPPNYVLWMEKGEMAKARCALAKTRWEFQASMTPANNPFVQGKGFKANEIPLGYFGEPAPALQASLTGPASIQRGARGTFSVTNAPAGATLSNWRFVGGGVTVQRAGNNNTADWQGTIVQAGTVSVDITVAKNVQTLSRAVVVTPRAWTENTPPIPLSRSGHGSLPVQPRLGRPGVDARDPGLGTSTTFERHDVRTSIIGDGPNAGFNFLASPPVKWDPRAFTNNALYDPSHPFFRAHDPSRRGVPLPGNRLQIGTIQLNVEAHEGIVIPPRQAPAGYASHWQKLLNHLAQPANQINIPLERDVSHRSRETNAQYAARIGRIITTRTAAAQTASRPHPAGIFSGAMYFNYPYINQRSLRLLVNGRVGQLSLSNPAGGRVVWTSRNPAVATVDSRGVVRPVAKGRTMIQVKNIDGDVDEIPVNVDV